MRLARGFGRRSVRCVLSLWIGGLVLSGLGCDRIEALKDQLLSSSKPSNAEDPALAAIRADVEAGSYDQALQRVSAYVQENPGSAEAFYYKGLCHLGRAGQPDLKAPLSEEEMASLEAFQRALSINPRHALSSMGLGDLYSRRVPARRRRGAVEDPEDPYNLALAAYEKAVTIDPKLAEAQLHYARFLEQNAQLDGADAAYRAAAEAAATVPEVAPDYYLAYGRFLAGSADRLEDALAQFDLALVFRQGDPTILQEMAVAHSRLGIRHLDKEEYLLAEEELKKAESLFTDKSSPDAQKTEEALQKLRSIRRR